MKTICFVVPTFPSISETFVVNQIIAAKKNGFKIKILVKWLGDISQSSQEQLILEHQLLRDVIVERSTFPKNKFKRYFKALLFIFLNFQFWNKLRSTEVKYKDKFIVLPYKIMFYKALKGIDVFHIQFAVAGLDLAVMKKVGVIKSEFITTFHGYDAHYSNDADLNKLQQCYFDLLNFSENITVNTPFLGKQVLRLGNVSNKLHVIPMGIDVNSFVNNKKRNILEKQIIKLLSIGRLIELKGFRYAIEAVNILVKQGYNLKYSIIGEGEEKKNLETLISNLNLENHVFLIDKKSQIEIRKILAVHDIFLMSSIIDSTGRGEAQGVVTAEAQASGLPVITFNCGGIPYTLKQDLTGFIVPEKNVSKYAEAIALLIKNPVMYDKMSKAAVQFATQNFSNEIMGQRFAKLYN